MNLSAIYSKTGKGARALASKNKSLSNNALRILSYIDGKTSAEIISGDFGKLSVDKFEAALKELINEGCIKEIGDDYLSKSLSEFEIVNPIEVAEISAEEFLRLDVIPDEIDNDTQAREKAEAEARAQAYEVEQARLREEVRRQEDAERKLLKVADTLAKSSDKLDIEALANPNTPLNPPTINQRKLKVRKEQLTKHENPFVAPVESEVAAQIAKEEKLRVEAASRDKEARKQRAAEAKAKQKVQDALEAHARKEAELKLKEAEALAKTQLELEIQSRREAEERARIEAERLAAKAKQKAEQEAMHAAEIKARHEAEEKARREAEKQARILEEKRVKAERKAQLEARAQAEREAKQRLTSEQDAKRLADKQSRLQAKAMAKREAEELARVAAEKKAKDKLELTQKKATENPARTEAKRQAKLLAQAQARTRAEEKALYQAHHPAPDYLGRLRNISPTAVKRSLAVTFSLFLVLLLVLPFINLSFLIGPTEELASASLDEPVTIKKMYVSFWPKPHWVLDEVSIGYTFDIKASSIKLYPALLTVTKPSKIFHSMEIQNLALTDSNLHKPATWLGKAKSQEQITIKHIRATQTSLNWHGLNLPVLNSEIKLVGTNRLEHMVIESADGLRLQFKPKNQHYAVTMRASNWKLPIGLPIEFDDLAAEGTLGSDQFVLQKISGRLYGGEIKASMTLQHVKDWRGDVEFQLSNINLAKATPLFTNKIGMQGNLEVNGLAKFTSDTLTQLFTSPSVTASFSSENGVIEGIDLVRAIQAKGEEKAISGTTGYDQFSGNLAFSNNRYKYENLKLVASQLQAQGKAEILADQALSGEVSISVPVKSRELHTRILLTGKLNQPRLK